MPRRPARFRPGGGGYSERITTDKQEIALLRILIACGEKTVEAFHASDNPIDREFVADLEKVIDRSRDELAALMADIGKPS